MAFLKKNIAMLDMLVFGFEFFQSLTITVIDLQFSVLLLSFSSFTARHSCSQEANRAAFPLFLQIL